MTTAPPNVFGVIADPTRRAILQLLRDGERPVGWVVDQFDVTPSAISQHLRALREAGLVRHRKDGRMRYYRLQPAGMEPVMDWLSYFDEFWDRRLENLNRHLSRKK